MIKDSVTLWGLLVAAAAIVIPACVGVKPEVLAMVYAALTPVVSAFFVYRGSKMGVVNGGTPK